MNYDKYQIDYQTEGYSFNVYKERFVDFCERAIMGDTEVLLFSGIIGLLWLIFGFDSYLNYRQRKTLIESVEPSDDSLSIMTRENYSKARQYALDRSYFNLFNSWYSMLQISIVLMTNIIPWLWSYTVNVTSPWNKDVSEIPLEDDLSEENETTASFAFLLYVITFSFVDVLPWKIYDKFVIEERYGINKQLGFSFLVDQLRNFVLTLLLILPIGYCLSHIIKVGGSQFYFYVWGISLVAMVFLTFIYPEFIAPLFEKPLPLNDRRLEADIEDLAERLQFPLTSIYVLQGSNQSRHSNSIFRGFWKNKQIILYDSLFGSKKIQNNFEDSLFVKTGDMMKHDNMGCSDEEVLAILAHELGHWKLNHVTQTLIIGQINLFVMFCLLGNVFYYGLMFKAFGFKEVGTPNLVKLTLIFQLLFSPYNVVLELFMNLLSRHNEFQADAFATKLGKGEHLIEALKKMPMDSMAFPIHDRWYSMLNNAQPPLLERIKAIKNVSETMKN